MRARLVDQGKLLEGRQKPLNGPGGHLNGSSEGRKGRTGPPPRVMVCEPPESLQEGAKRRTVVYTPPVCMGSRNLDT